MSDKYKVRDEQSGREFTIERELSPTERAERVGREASMWFWVFAIFGGFIILIAIWVIKTLADLTRRYPVILNGKRFVPFRVYTLPKCSTV